MSYLSVKFLFAKAMLKVKTVVFSGYCLQHKQTYSSINQARLGFQDVGIYMHHFTFGIPAAFYILK